MSKYDLVTEVKNAQDKWDLLNQHIWINYKCIDENIILPSFLACNSNNLDTFYARGIIFT